MRSEPDPVEYVRIAPEALRARDGRYELRVTNELEEVLYLDEARLLAIEHAAGVEVHPDEGMTHHPKPFGLVAVADLRTPRVVDAGGRDATERARAVDRSFVEGFGFERVRGYAKEHALTLDLSELPASHRVLLLTGWTDYAFSSDNVAASQMGLGLAGPRLEVETSPGTWRTAIEDLGIPVGRPQTVVADLGAVPLGPTARVRLVTNMRIYWDRIAVGRRARQELRPVALAPAVAVLRERGFSADVAAGGFEAYDFDYTRVSATGPWKTMPGRYTREGDVLDLLTGERRPLRGLEARRRDHAVLRRVAAARPGTRAHVPADGGWLQQGDGHQLGQPRYRASAAVPRHEGVSLRARRCAWERTAAGRGVAELEHACRGAAAAAARAGGRGALSRRWTASGPGVAGARVSASLTRAGRLGIVHMLRTTPERAFTSRKEPPR